MTLLGWMLPANATLVTIDFEDPPANFVAPEIYEEEGFRLLPSCHYHIMPDQLDWLPPQYGSGSQWFSADSSGCAGDGAAPFLPHDIVRLDAGGSSFHLLSLDVVVYGYDVTSSNGGLVRFCSPNPKPETVCAGELNFDGEEWRNLLWVDFQFQDPGIPLTGFDNIRVVRVPEPATLGLMLLGLTGLALRQRRRVLATPSN